MCVEFKMVACATKLITPVVLQVAQIKEMWKDQDVDDRISSSHSENWKVAATGTRAKIHNHYSMCELARRIYYCCDSY